MPFRTPNISKLLNKYKNLFGFTVEIMWCKLRRTNQYALIANPGQLLSSEPTYHSILTLVRDLKATGYFKRVEFTGVFPPAESGTREFFLNEFWVFRLRNDTKNKRIFGDYGAAPHLNVFLA